MPIPYRAGSRPFGHKNNTGLAFPARSLPHASTGAFWGDFQPFLPFFGAGLPRSTSPLAEALRNTVLEARHGRNYQVLVKTLMSSANLRVWGCNFSPETEAPTKRQTFTVFREGGEVTGSFLGGEKGMGKLFQSLKKKIIKPTLLLWQGRYGEEGPGRRSSKFFPHGISHLLSAVPPEGGKISQRWEEGSWTLKLPLLPSH